MTKVVFSSEQLPDQLDDTSRFKLWADLYTSQVCKADFVPLAEGRFSAYSAFAQYGEICAIHWNSALEKLVRTTAHIADDNRDDCFIGSLKNTPRNRLEQRRGEIELRQHVPYIVSGGQPITMMCDSRSELLGIAIPRKVLAERVAGFSCASPALFAPTPAWRHLDRYLSMLLSSDVGGDPALHRRIETHIVDLVALALGASGDSAELAKLRGLRAARLRDIIAEIEKGFANCTFTTEHVATRLGLSRRYINEILLESGATFSERVLELRLQRARTMLVDARHDKMRIGSIAFACGFTEVSYFNRRFRARFGASPMQYRGGSR